MDNIMDNHFEHTLGKMINDLKEVTTVPLTLEAQLADGLKTRNRLAHRYFRERATEFMTPAGRNQMIEELEVAQELFRTTDRALHATYADLRAKFGLTEERIAQAYEAMLAAERV